MASHLLRTFVTVARCGSFSAAADELGYTQSAVSQQIAALEADLGATLLTRRPVTVTRAGERLLQHADPILLRLAAARADIARVREEPSERLAIALSALSLGGPVATALGALRTRMPRLDVALRVLGRAAVVTAVATGDAELGLVDGIVAPSDPLRLPDSGPFTMIGVAERPLVVVLPAAHPLAGGAAPRLDDLVDARWIEAPEITAPLALLRGTTGAETLRAPLAYDGTDTAGLLALVAAGHGLALLPAGLPLPPDVRGVPLRAPALVHRVELVHGHLASGAARWLAAHLAARLAGRRDD